MKKHTQVLYIINYVLIIYPVYFFGLQKRCTIAYLCVSLEENDMLVWSRWTVVDQRVLLPFDTGPSQLHNLLNTVKVQMNHLCWKGVEHIIGIIIT